MRVLRRRSYGGGHLGQGQSLGSGSLAEFCEPSMHNWQFDCSGLLAGRRERILASPPSVQFLLVLTQVGRCEFWFLGWCPVLCSERTCDPAEVLQHLWLCRRTMLCKDVRSVGVCDGRNVGEVGPVAAHRMFPAVAGMTRSWPVARTDQEGPSTSWE